MRPHFQLCHEALDEGRYRAGLVNLTELVREASTPAELLVAARAAGMAMLPGLHLRLLRKAVRDHACPPEGYLALAERYVGTGHFLETEELLAPHLNRWSARDHALGLALISVSLAGRRRFRSAAQALAEVEDLVRQAPAGEIDEQAQLDLLFARLTVLYHQDQWEEVESELAIRLAEGAAQARFYLLLAACQEHLGRLDGALEAVQAGCARLPEHPYLGLALAGSAWTLDQSELAFAALDRLEAGAVTRKLRRAVQRLRALYRRSAVRLKVPPVRQAHNHCFPACLSMVASFWGRPADHRQLGRSVMDGDRGTPLYQALRYLADDGWRCLTFRATIERLKTLIDRGVPAILGLEYAGGAHVHVCVGYDDKSLVVQDPTSVRRRWLPFDRFDRAYALSDHWALVFTPPAAAHLIDDLPAADDRQIRQVEACWAALSDRDKAAAEEPFTEMTKAAPSVSLRLFRLRVWPRLGTREEALAAGAELLEAFPDHREIRLEVAGHLERLGENEQAIAIAREGVGRLSPPALMMLARAAAAANAPEATALFRKAAIGDPQKADIMAQWGRWEAKAGRLDQAEALFTAVCEMEPKPIYAADLADLHTYRDRPAEAVSGLRKVLRDERRYPWAWWRRAEAHWQLRQRRAAIRCLRIAVAQAPDDQVFSLRMARLLEAAGRSSAAVKLLRESPALKSAPDLQAALAQACLNRGEWAQALAVALPAVERYPQDVRFAPMAADALRNLGRADEGRPLLEELVRRRPDNAYCHGRLGHFLLLTGEAAEGVAACRRAVELEPEQNDPISSVTDGLGQMADPRPALAFLAEQVERWPDLRWRIAWGWRRIDEAAALRWADEALVAEQRSPHALAEYGHLALGMGRTKVAESSFRGALDEGPLDWACYGMALLARQEKQKPDEVAWLRRAVAAAREPEKVRRYTDLLGDQLEREQDWAGLQAVLDSVQRQVPEAWRLTYLGYVAEKQNQAGTAVQMYEKAIRLDPALLWAHYRRPQALLLAERHEEALLLADAALNEWPNQNGLLWVAGRCRQALGRREEAAGFYLRSLALKADWNPPRQSLWELFAADGWPALEAQGLAFPAAERARLYTYFGVAFDQAGQQENARTAWAAAIAADQDYTDPHFHLAEAALKDAEPALAWEGTVTILRRNSAGAYNFARWLTERTPPEVAAAALERVAGELGEEARLTRADLWWLAGECYQNQKTKQDRQQRRRRWLDRLRHWTPWVRKDRERLTPGDRAADAWRRAVLDRPDHRSALSRLDTYFWHGRQYESLVATVAPSDEAGTLPADIPGLLGHYLVAAQRLGRPSRPHWRNLITRRIWEINDRRNAYPGEVDALRQQYERLEAELGNLRAASLAWVFKDDLANWLRVLFLRLLCLLRRAPVDVRAGESTAPVITQALCPWERWQRPSVKAWISRNPLSFALAILIIIWIAVAGQVSHPQTRVVTSQPPAPRQESPFATLSALVVITISVWRVFSSRRRK